MLGSALHGFGVKSEQRVSGIFLLVALYLNYIFDLSLDTRKF